MMIYCDYCGHPEAEHDDGGACHALDMPKLGLYLDCICNHRVTEFQPELGQLLRDDSYGEVEASDLCVAVLSSIANEVTRVMGNREQRPVYMGSNGGEEFIADAFEMRDYCWCEGDRHPGGCPPNFRWRDFEARWYKHLGRSTSCNREITSDELAVMLTDCLESARRMDTVEWM